MPKKKTTKSPVKETGNDEIKQMQEEIIRLRKEKAQLEKEKFLSQGQESQEEVKEKVFKFVNQLHAEGHPATIEVMLESANSRPPEHRNTGYYEGVYFDGKLAEKLNIRQDQIDVWDHIKNAIGWETPKEEIKKQYNEYRKTIGKPLAE
jgi:hypothetical protein